MNEVRKITIAGGDPMKTISDLMFGTTVARAAVILEAALITVSLSILISYFLGRFGLSTFAIGSVNVIWIVISIVYYRNIWVARA